MIPVNIPTQIFSHSNNFDTYSSLGAQRWGDFEAFKGTKVLGPASTTVMHHLGDQRPSSSLKDDQDNQKKASFNLNVGHAQEVLRRELPFVFVLSNLDFSIFSPYITVADGNSNKMVMPKNLYATAVKSLKIAASFSSTFPSMNVKKIEYIEDSSAIQCLVDIVLPDTIRIEGQSVWEGMFYFGLDEHGLINSHVMDRKISNLRPSLKAAHAFPWVQSRSMWSADLLAGVASTAGASGSDTAGSASASAIEQSNQ